MEELVEELAKCFNIKANDISKNPFVASIIKNIDKDDISKLFEQPNKYPEHNIPLNLYESSQCLTVVFELPGVSKKDISLSLSSDFVLKVTVKKSMGDYESMKCITREIREGQLTRSFSLPESVGKSMTAKYDNGFLTVTFMKQHVDETQINID